MSTFNSRVGDEVELPQRTCRDVSRKSFKQRRLDGTTNVQTDDLPLRLNVVIQVVGSRGDIQPFIALGKQLKAVGHRVRLATHLTFRNLVLSEELEFFNIGGNPTELMAFMVKNSGLIPKLETIRRGTVQKRRREMKQIIDGCWHSCFETGDGTHLHHIMDDVLGDATDDRRRPFVADAIIANPPSLAHIHCAERLGIPLHLMFTMPWSPTQFLPHPLAITHPQECRRTIANYVSYAVVDLIIWEGLGDLVNRFRKTCLTLDPLDTITGSSVTHTLKIPYTYFWSQGLLPKPPDWPDHIEVCGFISTPQAPDYQPPQEITDFLNAGGKPIYVGFGSIVVDNSTRLFRIVLDAVASIGQRAIISRGWADLGDEDRDVPENVLVIGSIPHDWLFQHVSCVIHHGGAGTTAAGLAHGCPTVIVPFFGDQHFWGNVVAKAGAGPAPIPYRDLTSKKLIERIQVALQPEIQQAAQEIQVKMSKESGLHDSVRSFHRHLNLQLMQCDTSPKRPAVWRVRHTNAKLSAFAASVLLENRKISPQDLLLYHSTGYDTYRNPADPVSAVSQILLGILTSLAACISDIPGATLSCLLSAHRVLGEPYEHFDPYVQCQRHRTAEGKKSIMDRLHGIKLKKPFRLGNENCVKPILAKLSPRHSDGQNTNLRLTEQKSSYDNDKLLKMHQIASKTAFILSITSKKALYIFIKLPADISLTLSQSFHNAPLLYNDHLVKPRPQVTGVLTGLKGAGKELKDSFYDGVTGLYLQPLYSFEHGEAKNLSSGFAKGLAGLFIKPLAGLFGVVGYPLHGLRKEINRSLRKSMDVYLKASRFEQGREEMHTSSAEERMEVLENWASIEVMHKRPPPSVAFIGDNRPDQKTNHSSV
ncbi:Sterol 3-beta-glucosyltransferase [Penicillium ucsense]|uniref:Sterol 3-beta-glucosyltransferase n=1 Tax=Penicillium ucsense TaxID=2839758 RepID=A0A8J8W6T5_9EURO|nr:Sterol 3-beta-glucosyltransferase [Penicillium ucsense]KAF7737158.1 Sterol 3-beta-glucosyltransferase [Penicillium ucsense]